ncbi:MAG: coproporphyrinogen III oxidase, partial [Gammaproteobacteria bacterium]
PERFKPQRRINESELPSPAEKLEILHHTINKLTDAGYVFIGMDHFALPEDELAVAQRQGTLYRNFQGYSTHADCDMISMGVTSIGYLGGAFSQNEKEEEPYYQRIDAGEIPIIKGYELNADDHLRRAVIVQLICHFGLDIAAIESAFGIDFKQYFADAYPRLEQMAEDGLIELDDQGIRIQPVGRLLVRQVCMAFDAYLQANAKTKFSRAI